MLEVKDRKFYLDGKEFVIHSGAFHYFRALPEYWEDILTKIKAAGLNCVETYTCWNLHEPHKGTFDFSGRLDLARFIETADKVGLKVILRTGPFICAEWENGGLPSWLLKKEYGIRMRCYSEPYLTHLKDWFSVLLPKIVPYLDSHGGPVIAMAVENEYGSFGDDFRYLKFVEDIYKNEGIDCLLISADGQRKYHLGTGSSGPHIVRGVDGGSADGLFNGLRDDEPRFTTEFWAGNFTDWGFPSGTKIPNEHTKAAFNSFVDQGASFNIYMFYGGTNFGFTSGANANIGGYKPVTTSYDYDAAITEWGGYTERYFDMREAMARCDGYKEETLPASPHLQTIGDVLLTQSASLWDNPGIGRHFKSQTVEPMEEFDQIEGYIVYKKTLTYDAELDCIKIRGLHDRAIVYVNGEVVGIRMRDEDESVIELSETLKAGDVIEVFVENMGRICYGEETFIGDRKGITEAVVLTYKPDGVNVRNPGKIVFDWEISCYDMADISGVGYRDGIKAKCPAFFRGTFRAAGKDSCFIHFPSFKKGIVFVNGFNLGRYWERGPQTSLYLPGVLLKEENEIVVFETDGITDTPRVVIDDEPAFRGRHPEIFV